MSGRTKKSKKSKVLNKKVFNNYVESCDISVSITEQIRGLLHEIRNKIMKIHGEEEEGC